MSRWTWNLVKNSKGFYIKTYRKSIIMLFVSASVNILLGIGIFYVYNDFPDSDFFATSGVTPPIQLTPLDSPNYTSVPLLANDLMETDDERVIPR